MTKFKSWLMSASGRIILLSILTTLILPWGFTLLHVHVALRVTLLWILINVTLAIYIGRTIAKYPLGWWHSLWLPLLFALMVWVRFADYGYWFAPIYWVLTMLTLTRE